MLTDFLGKYSDLQLEAYVVANRMHWDKLKINLKTLPYSIRFVDAGSYRGQDFVREMISLNEKAYGVGMAAPSWTYANFGTIGAGVTSGFLSQGVPVSKFNIVGNAMDPEIAHEWTLLVDPDFQGRSLASLTVAFALQMVSDKKYFTFLTQTDNSAINTYLKFPKPLQILAYGFVHTKRNSFMFKTEIPQNPFSSFLQNLAKEYSLEDYPIVKMLPKDVSMFWVPAQNHQLLLDLNEQIITGGSFSLRGKTTKGTTTYLLISRD